MNIGGAPRTDHRHRRIVVTALCGLMVLVGGDALLAKHWKHAEPKAQPIQKIILMSIDALRADRLGCYGYQKAETSPTLDAWAPQAVLFEHAYAQAPWTIPSLGSLMSGRYAREVGAYTNSIGDIDSSVETLAERLRRAGYQTGFFNTNPILLRPGVDRGFDLIAPPKTGSKIPYIAVEPQVMEWLEKNAGNKFFLWIHDMDTHAPPTEGNPYRGQPGWNAYDAEVRWVDEALRRLFAKLDALGIRDQALFIFTADHGEAFDEHHMSGHQNVIYDEVLHVPLIVQYPGMVRAGRVAVPVRLLDANPTIAELAGLPGQPGSRGKSVVPLMASHWFSRPRHAEHPYIFSARYYFETDQIDATSGKVLTKRGTHQLAVHDRQWKLIAKVQGTQGPPERLYLQPDWDTSSTARTDYELYDLATDPLEQHDVFAANSAVATRLQKALAAFKLLTSDGPNNIRITIDPAIHEAMHALGYDSDLP